MLALCSLYAVTGCNIKAQWKLFVNCNFSATLIESFFTLSQHKNVKRREVFSQFEVSYYSSGATASAAFSFFSFQSRANRSI